MDCTKARELMWEDELSEEFFAHIEGCPECRKAYELVKKTKAVLNRPDDMEGAVMKKIKKAEHARKISLITKVAAVFVAVLAVGIFAKIIIDNGLEKSGRDASENNIVMTEKEDGFSASGSNGTYGEFVDKGLTDKEDSADDYDVAPEEPYYEEPMAPSIEEAPSASDRYTPDGTQNKEDLSKDDVNMFLNEYKDMNTLPVHTADIVVSGDNIKYAREVLEKFSPEQCDYHIEIQGDFYFEVQEALQGADFEIVLTTSSETIKKTLVFFDSLIK